MMSSHTAYSLAALQMNQNTLARVLGHHHNNIELKLCNIRDKIAEGNLSYGI